MTVKQYVSCDNKSLTIEVEDRFDFSLHQKFRDAYINCTNEGTVFTIELLQTSYIDSSALGMILLLNDHVNQYKGKLILNKPNETVYKILEIAQFHRLFTIVM